MKCKPVCVHVSPRSALSDGTKRVEASSRGNSSGRQNVWDATGWVKTRPRIPRPQRVDYHAATAAGPGWEEKEETSSFLNFITFTFSLNFGVVCVVLFKDNLCYRI